MPEKLGNGGFTLKAHQMFFIKSTPGKQSITTIAAITGQFGFVFEENSVKEIKRLSAQLTSFENKNYFDLSTQKESS